MKIIWDINVKKNKQKQDKVEMLSLDNNTTRKHCMYLKDDKYNK